jgi:3-oxoacyl-(acyl-carrier-protein) synthase
VVTGIGAVTPFGGLATSLQNIRARQSAIAPVRAFDASAFAEHRGAECIDFDARSWFRIPKSLKLADRRTQLAVAAASMAFVDAGLDAEHAMHAGVLIGTTGHDMQVLDLGRALGPLSDGDVTDIDFFGSRILRKLPPLWLLVNLPNMASAHVAIQLGAHGPNSTITTDWIAGLQAIGEASRWIEDGEADVVIAGGADSGILPLLYATLDVEHFFADGDPSFVPGEGAALFIVEELQHARRRNARILCELTGYATSAADDALVSTLRGAMQQSGHNTPDLLCDAAVFTRAHREAEERAMRSVFDTVPDRFECNSLLGFAMSAAAPIALALALAGRDAAQHSLLVNSLGALHQGASLAVRIGDSPQ